MDIEKNLIFINGKESTESIVSYVDSNEEVQITYSGPSNKVYGYKKTNHQIERFVASSVIELGENERVYVKNIWIEDVLKICYFPNHARLIFSKKDNLLYDLADIELRNNDALSAEAKEVLAYWGDVAKHTRLPEDDAKRMSFLKLQMDKLRFLKAESVLWTYLHQAPITFYARSTEEPIFPFRFNLSQYEAVQQALENSLSVIEGPPGTGKTQTILNALANLAVVRDCKVAVVSSNNAAVQNVREKLDAAGYGFLVAALGNQKNQIEFFASPPKRNLEGYQEITAEADLAELQTRLSQIAIRIRDLMESEKQKVLLEQEAAAHRLEKKHFDHYFEKQDIKRLGKLSFYKQSSEKALKFLAESNIAARRGKSNSWLRKVRLVLGHGFTHLSKLKENEMDVLLEYQHAYYELKIDELEQKIESIRHLLQAESFDDLIIEHQKTSETILKLHIWSKYKHIKPIQEDRHSYKKNMERFMQTYPVILSTAQSLLNCIPSGFLFDYVIIDESSQMNLIETALVLSCSKRAIVVGDTCQLSQIITQEMKTKFNEADQKVASAFSYLNQNMLSSLLEIYEQRIPKTLLKEHYRCHPQIIDFCNTKYYDGKLVTFTLRQDQDQPLQIYRTAKGNHMREVTRGDYNKGKFNQRELDVIQKEVLVNLERAVRRNTDFGFVTPYRKQADKAMNQLEDMECDTVHKYQGREKKTMIMSTVVDHSRQGKMGLKFVNDPRMLNVAVSRAQERFILVVGHEMFGERNSEVGDLIRHMEYNTLDEEIIESEIVSVFDLLYKKYSHKLNNLESRIWGKSKFRSENIMNTRLSEILDETPYRMLEYTQQVFLKNRFQNLSRLSPEQQQYIRNGASVDFEIYHKLDKEPLFAIEVDGFHFHENNPKQLWKDQMKNEIFASFGLPLLRVQTNESGEEEKIREILDQQLGKSRQSVESFF